MADAKTLTNRLRRMAHRNGMRLVKTRGMSPDAKPGTGFMLVEQKTDKIVVGRNFAATLDDVERALQVLP